MPELSKNMTKRIYALAAVTGVLESGNKNDLLHNLVRGISGKDSVKALTSEEALKVIRKLEQLPKKPRKKQKKVEPPDPGAQPGMMSVPMQEKAWALIYELIDLDKKDGVPSRGTAGERMAGAIRKILHMDVELSDPFRWVDDEQAWLLIEQLKRYVSSREAQSRKRQKGA